MFRIKNLIMCGQDNLERFKMVIVRFYFGGFKIVKKLLLLIFFSNLFPNFFSVAQARVFDMNKESLSAYLKGSYWSQPIKNTAMSESAGTGVELDANFKNNLSGEFGFVYSAGSINWRFGFEVIRPPPIVNGSGTDASGTALYDVNSEAAAYSPKVGIELNFLRQSLVRAFIYGGYGSAYMTGRNSYVLSSAGTTTLAPVVDFYEDLRSTASLIDASLGFEVLMADTTTFVLEAGYRDLKFMKIKHNRDVTGFQGAVVKGDPAMNMDGSDRTLNLSGPYAAVHFRFWLK